MRTAVYCWPVTRFRSVCAGHWPGNGTLSCVAALRPVERRLSEVCGALRVDQQDLAVLVIMDDGLAGKGARVPDRFRTGPVRGRAAGNAGRGPGGSPAGLYRFGWPRRT
jgi:hypothetical protein